MVDQLERRELAARFLEAHIQYNGLPAYYEPTIRTLLKLVDELLEQTKEDEDY